LGSGQGLNVLGVLAIGENDLEHLLRFR
jgi:hypothetical protein